jgi:uroporphyrinogen decarboxylase
MTTNDKPGPMLIDAFAGRKTPRIPVWYMRQAGRYLPEYNELRRGRSFLELSETVELAVEVSLQPFRRFAVDGIIMFSDILTPLKGAGIPLHFEEKKGPVLDQTVADESELRHLRADFDPAVDTAHVADILKTLRAHIDALPAVNESGLPGRPALLGFAGAPFTLASYLIEGGTSKKFEKTKGAVFGATDFFHRLSERLTDLTIRYLKMQIDAGADAVQIFDSWAGILSPADYAEFAAPYTQRIVAALQEYTQKPVILFVGNSAHLLTEMIAQKPRVLSLDWRVQAGALRREMEAAGVQNTMAVQGNMDPLTLYGSIERVRRAATRVLENFANLSKQGGYVFNLGHGIHPGSPIPNVQAMLDTIRGYRL